MNVLAPPAVPWLFANSINHADPHELHRLGYTC
jgi:hypothetical protein